MKISVIIPVYNLQPYIETCIASVQKQTLKDLEIICVNDGSTDDSLIIMRHMQEMDDRIHIISQLNQGAGKARNNALLQAKGEYILFLDGDDYLLDATALQQMYNACIEQKVQVCGAFRSVDRQGTIAAMGLHRKDCEDYPLGRKISYFNYQYDFHFSTYLYQRKMLVEHQIFFPDYRRFQDPPFFVKAMAAAGAFYVIPVELYCFRSGHQNHIFSASKVNDIVRGITDILEISSREHLKKLHMLEVSRLNEGYFWHIVQNITAENPELLQLLLKANQMVNWEWVNEDREEKQFLLKSLKFILHAGEEKCENYRKELVRRGCGDVSLGMVFPFHKIPPSSKIVLYAAGMMGWAYYEQIKDSKEYELVGWVDQQYKKFKGKLPRITSLESVHQMTFDYLVIAIEDERTALEIKDFWKEAGIPEEKIIWSLSM
ncbi:MAG: glycosyltransferase family 2 protein [Ruminococcus flavefaciens]|nr:glycosyltransferase family 2 protein [Ruminococcus flavefaciens]